MAKSNVLPERARCQLCCISPIENVWIPAYLDSFVHQGKLIEAAKAGQTERVEFWARLAIKEIDKKRREFLDPLQRREDALIAEVDAAFDRVLNANAAVTANLNSVLTADHSPTQAIKFEDHT